MNYLLQSSVNLIDYLHNNAHTGLDIPDDIWVPFTEAVDYEQRRSNQNTEVAAPLAGGGAEAPLLTLTPRSQTAGLPAGVAPAANPSQAETVKPCNGCRIKNKCDQNGIPGIGFDCYEPA